MTGRGLSAVFFDVDDTLVDFDAAARLGFLEALGEDVAYETWLALCIEHYPRYTRGEVDFQTMRHERMMALLAGLGRPADRATATRLEARRMSTMESAYALFPDALPCLDEMRARGLPVGLITNNEGQHQRRKLRRTGLDEVVDEIVISGEVGVAKPDPAIFELACARLGVEPGDAAHAGDRLIDDALGATRAGLRGIWLARPEAIDAGVARDRADGAGVGVIRGLGELPGLLDALG